MEITNIKIFKSNRKAHVLAYANIVLDNQFIIRGITLLETERNGRFISMPSRRIKGIRNSHRDIFHPLNNDVRTELTKIIFDAYDESIENKE